MADLRLTVMRWTFLIAQLLFGALVCLLAIPLLFVSKLINFRFRWPTVNANPKSIVITGASYGLGAGFAEYYAKPGVVLGLTARSADKLRDVQQACVAKGATVVLGAVDVTDESAMREFLQSFDNAHPIDLLLANAGVTETTVGLDGQLEAATRRLTDINLIGVYNTIFPVLERMKVRRAGQVAIMSSLAGFGALTGAVAYSTTKVAVKALAYGLRGVYARDNVSVVSVNPGFIRTPMTDAARGFRMPMLMEQGPAIEYMAQQMAANVGVIAFPWPMYLAVWIMQNLLPDEARDILVFPFMALGQRRNKQSAAAAASASASASAAGATAAPAKAHSKRE